MLPGIICQTKLVTALDIVYLYQCHINVKNLPILNFNLLDLLFWLSIKHNSKRKNKLNNKPNDIKVMLVETLEKFPNHIP